MATEQSLYTQVVKLWFRDFKFVATDQNKNEAKFKFQGQSARSQIWFDLDLNWVEINLSTREPDFYKKLFQSHDDTQDDNRFNKFQNDAPILKYCKKTLNSCCLISLASAFSSINHNAASNAISMRIEESLKNEVGNRIDFVNDILKNKKINKGEPKVHYNLMKYNKMREYKNLEDISADVTLVQLMDSLVNVNHAISVVGNWIFYSNY